ncbi:MAG: hypothetical protein Tsb0013_15470 [Phycisphaerales bacterium]
MVRRVLLLALCLGLLAPAALTSQASMTPEEQRMELIKVLEQRVLLHERRVELLREQAEALRNGADLEAIRASIREDASAPLPPSLDAPPGPDRPGIERDRPRLNDRFADRAERGERDRQRPQREATPEMVDGLMLMIRSENPVFADRLERLREERPELFERVIQRIIREFPRGDDELASLGIQVRATEFALRDLADRIKQNPDDRSRFADDIRAALNAAADARIAYERFRIQRERDELERREQFLETMEARRDEFIESRLGAILEGKDLTRIPGRERRERPEGQHPERNPDRLPPR